MDENVTTKLDTFFKKYKKYSYKKGEVLLSPPNTPSGVFYLQEGIVKQYALSLNGDEVTLNTFKSLSFFPMDWAINNTPNDYFFEAVTDIEVWKAPREDVVTFLKNEPEVLFNLVSRIYKGLHGLFLRLTHLVTGNAQSRLITELLIQTKRFGTHDHTSSIIKITEKDLGIQTGMSRETVSREMKRLKDKGIVEIQLGTIKINDVQKLEEELLSLS
jgi:CRP-like cAMP-binding protein